MSISQSLALAYRHHRADGLQKYRGFAVVATEALRRARADVATGVPRYPYTGPIYGAVAWQRDNPRGERIGFVQSLEGAGLRYVGRASIEGRRGAFSANTSEGWLTDPFGDVFKDGTGLCWGVVYQLPARHGVARYVSGYIMGGCSDDLPTVDFATIYESTDNYSDGSPTECDAARQAAGIADEMARIAAESERDYQRAWQSGSAYAATLEELASIRRRVLATFADMRATCDALKALPETLRTRLRASLDSDLAERAELHKRLSELMNGSDETLGFWTGDKALRAAFNEGAGRPVLA